MRTSAFVFFYFLNAFHFAFGKFPVTNKEYVLMPSIHEYDNYDRCMLYEEKALYCRADILMSPSNNTQITKPWEIIQRMDINIYYFRHDMIKRGICLTSRCANITEDVIKEWRNTDLMKNILSNCVSETLRDEFGLEGTAKEIECMTNQPVYPVTNSTYILRTGLIVLFSLIVFATVFDRLIRYKTPEEYNKITSTKAIKIITSFSLLKNWKSLISENISEDKSLSCIQGVRFLTMLTILVMHSSGLMLHWGPITNPDVFEKGIDNMYMQIFFPITFFMVQGFFIISSMLLSYNFFLLMDNNPKVDLKLVLLSFINRILRLVPCVLFLIALQLGCFIHTGSGPYWAQVMNMDYENCGDYSWTNLLFLNNYVNKEKMCLPHTWYLAADMQLYTLNLLILTFIWKYRTHEKFILFLTLIGSLFTTGAITYYYNYDMIIKCRVEATAERLMNIPQFHHTYTSALGNLGSSAIGLILGYLYYTYKGSKPFENAPILKMVWASVIFWMIFAPLLLGTIALQDWYVPNRLWSAIYAGLAKNSFSGGIGLLMLASAMDIDWTAASFLKWKPFYFLGKLGFCGYLIQLITLQVRLGYTRSYIAMNPFVVTCGVYGDVCVALLSAMFMYLCVELPFQNLQKLLVPQLSEKRKKCSNQSNLQPFEANCSNENLKKLE